MNKSNYLAIFDSLLQLKNWSKVSRCWPTIAPKVRQYRLLNAGFSEDDVLQPRVVIIVVE